MEAVCYQFVRFLTLLFLDYRYERSPPTQQEEVRTKQGFEALKNKDYKTSDRVDRRVLKWLGQRKCLKANRMTE